MKGNHKRYSVFVVLCWAFMWPLPWVQADQVYLKNGDRLTGKVISLGKGRLLLHTAYAGELSIRWETIASLKTDGPVVLTLHNDERLYGWFASEGKEDNVFLSDLGKHAIVPPRILSIRLLSEEERQRAGSFDKPALWKHRLESGLQVRSGNVDATDATVGYQTQRQSDIAQFEAEISGSYGKTEGERTAQQARAGGRFDLLHTMRFYSFYLATDECGFPTGSYRPRRVPHGGGSLAQYPSDKSFFPAFQFARQLQQ